METSSYLFMSTQKRRQLFCKIMEKQSNEASNISLDSLELANEETSPLVADRQSSDEAIQTILVPFYEKDVLIKVPKEHKKKQSEGNKGSKSSKKDLQEPSNYLVNKDKQNGKRSSYLELFRKQFFKNEQRQTINDEIRSISPQFGDTEMESIGDSASNPVAEFYNTESYNEIYYEKLMNNENYVEYENSFEDDVQDDDNVEAIENLRSVSEVSQPRRRRRATVAPIQSVKLGGLGPDMEKIKPRLERARSLQRYSEKVRMENRLRIYKQNVQAEEQRRTTRDSPARNVSSNKDKKEKAKIKDELNNSYLVNKSAKYSKTQQNAKSISEQRNDSNDNKRLVSAKKGKDSKAMNQYENDQESRPVTRRRVSATSKDKAINTEFQVDEKVTEVSPLKISFLVNVGGLRPSSALRDLEEKHRMYQEQVKSFTFENRN